MLITPTRNSSADNSGSGVWISETCTNSRKPIAMNDRDKRKE